MTSFNLLCVWIFQQIGGEGPCLWRSSRGSADSVMHWHTTGLMFNARCTCTFWMTTTITASWSWAFADVCVEGRGRISRLGMTQDIKRSSSLSQSDVPHQCIPQHQVGPGVCILWRDGVLCPVSESSYSCVAAHWSVNHCFKKAPSWHDLRRSSDVKPKQKKALIDAVKTFSLSINLPSSASH